METLLIDRTMTALNAGAEVNIKWAVDDYAKEYPDRTGYGCEDQISIDAISSGDGKDLKVVTPHVKKRKEEQERRTAQKTEVLTPSWICNEQNNLVDEAWFGRKGNLFNKPNRDYKMGFDVGANYPQLRWKATYGKHSIPFLHNKKEQSSEDLLFQMLLETHIPLSDKIEKKTVGGNEVFFVSGTTLVACLDAKAKMTTDFFIEIAKLKPGIAFFRDDAFADDSARTNLQQAFDQFSPSTAIKII